MAIVGGSQGGSGAPNRHIPEMHLIPAAPIPMQFLPPGGIPQMQYIPQRPPIPEMQYIPAPPRDLPQMDFLPSSDQQQAPVDLLMLLLQVLGQQ